MVRKEDKSIILVVIFIFIILMAFTTTAGIFDWLKKITGEAVQTVKLNITIGAGTAPQIINISQMTPAGITLTEGPLSTNLSYNFSVYDADGATNLNDTSATVNLTMFGETTRNHQRRAN